MRKVKVLFCEFAAKRIEQSINEAFAEIESGGGKVVKTEYLVDKTDAYVTVVIEYEDKT